MQEVDAERRLAILRGEVPPRLPEAEGTDEPAPTEDEGRVLHRQRSRKKRKLPGEDDTDFELRLANERDDSTERPERTRKPTSSAPITDRAGHIDLLGDNRLRRRGEKNEEAEKEAQKKKQELEDQYTMRFSNAAGRNGTHDPWYSKSDPSTLGEIRKDVWGNEDSGRQERDAQRMASNDPLAMMKKGASQVRMLNRERKRFQEEREGELRQLRKEQSKRTSHRRDEERPRHRDRYAKSDRRRRRSHDRRDERFRDDDSRHRRGGRVRNDEKGNRRRSRSPEHSRNRHEHET